MQPREVRTKRRPPRTVPKRWAAGNTWNQVSTPRSVDSSAGSSHHTPTSSAQGSIPSVLSDLTGSYKHGRTGGDGQKSTTPWTHAKILSKPPKHPQPHRDDCSVSIATPRKQHKAQVDPEAGVELYMPGSPPRRSSEEAAAVLVPIVILIMDPQQKTYELSQQWIDPVHDTVRDCLHSLQKGLHGWPQDYDGLFSVRNNHFNQLIHILNVSRYDVEPYEVWIAKPWAMAAQATVEHAGVLLNHLKTLGILSYTSSFYLSAHRKRFARPKTDDAVLTLSREAQERTYVTGGIVKERHACQCLAFSPPFEMTTHMSVPEATCVPINIQANDHDDASQLSSQCGTSVEGNSQLPDHVSFADSQASTVRAAPNLSHEMGFASSTFCGNSARVPNEDETGLLVVDKRQLAKGKEKERSTCGPRLSWMLCRHHTSSPDLRQERDEDVLQSDTFVANDEEFMDFAVWEEASFGDQPSVASERRQLGYC